MTVDADLLRYYADEFDESDRLETKLRGRLEGIRVQELLRAYLGDRSQSVADIGGGAGWHAIRLHADGHDVKLLDPIERHVVEARAAGIDAVVGDARDLPWAAGEFDVALLAGPLYHLIDPLHRVCALREAVRVVRPGGCVAAVAHNRFANVYGATLANQLDERWQVVEDILRQGHSPHNDRLPASSYYHSVTELVDEFNMSGLRRTRVHGVSGPGGWLGVIDDRYELGQDDDKLLRNAIEGARMADRYPELTSASSILLAIGDVR